MCGIIKLVIRMILEIRINNFLAFNKPITINLKSDLHIKKFIQNVYSIGNVNVGKVNCFYGVNNVGKTCLVRAIQTIKNVLLGLPAEVAVNLFTNSLVCELGITFIYEDNIYSYDFKYDNTSVDNFKKGFVYECLKSINYDKYKNCTAQIVFLRDTINKKFFINYNMNLINLLDAVSTNNILIYTINNQNPYIKKYYDILRGFASKIDILNMNNIPIYKTIDVLKNNKPYKDKVINLIKMADIDIDDYKYLNNTIKETSQIEANEQVLVNNISVNDVLNLTSVHKGKNVQSLVYDSTGTQKIVAAASYIVDAILNNRILVVDELDSSLHYKLTRAIISLFNNVINKGAQLLLTAHDLMLLDVKKLFRKDQIFFIMKDRDGVFAKSLADFTNANDNIRSDTNVLKRYIEGDLIDLPEPDFISALI